MYEKLEENSRHRGGKDWGRKQRQIERGKGERRERIWGMKGNAIDARESNTHTKESKEQREHCVHTHIYIGKRDSD